LLAKRKSPFQGCTWSREATPTGGIPHKGAEKNYNRNKTGKRVTQLGAGMNPSKLTNPQFFSQVRKKTFRKISNSKAEYPYPPTPTLGQGFASRLPKV
jgi:hypothetical protein